MQNLTKAQFEAINYLIDNQQMDFDTAQKSTLFSALTARQKIQVKAEFQRLNAPEKRNIDMRGVDSEASEHHHFGLTHYFNEAGLRRYQVALERYRRYTVGVYEDLINFINDLKTQRPDSRDFHEFTSPRVTFFDFAHRQDERMHLSMTVMVYVENTQRVEAKTIDISATGLQIKVPKLLDITNDNSVDIVFTGLQEDYPDFANKPVAYNVIKQVEEEDKVRVYLHIIEKKSQVVYVNFIEQFISGNKHRYKVNLSNTLDALRNKACEQYFTPYFPSLPLFIESQNEQYSVRFAMLNNNNSQILSYWQDEEMQQRISDLVSHERIKQLLSHSSEMRELFVYSFIHFRDNKVYFFSASQLELIEHQTRDFFLSYASNRASFRVFKLQLSDMSAEQAFTPLSIPNSGHRYAKEFNSDTSARLLSQLKNLRYIVSVSDVTPSHTQNLWREHPLDKTGLARLQNYSHPHNRIPAQADIVRYKDVDVRKDVRYILRTPITIKTDYGEFAGMTDDFSVSGLRIELENGLPILLDKRVYVSFPRFDKMTDAFTLLDLPYDIIKIHHNRHVLHLHADTQSDVTSRDFFAHLIKRNKSKLKADIMKESVPGLNHFLRCIYAKNAMNIAFFINQHAKYFAPDFSVYNSGDGRLRHVLTFFTQDDAFNLEFLYRDREEVSPMIQRCMQHLVVDDEPCIYEIFIAVNRNAKHFNDAFKPFLTKDFASQNAAKTFIEKALEQGEFIAIKLYLQQTREPDLETLQAELEYVNAHSEYHANNIYNQLESIVGFGYILDITDEILFRSQFSDNVIANNQNAFLNDQIAS